MDSPPDQAILVVETLHFSLLTVIGKRGKPFLYEYIAVKEIVEEFAKKGAFESAVVGGGSTN